MEKSLNIHFIQDEIFNGAEIVPYFQPILSIETQLIYAYEVLGRLILPDGKVKSLGSFFTSSFYKYGKGKTLSGAELFQIKRLVDRDIREKAIRQFYEKSPSNSRLFLNISPNLMLSFIEDWADSIPHTIKKVMEMGVDPERIVIEITEDHISENIENIKPLIKKYKDFGFSIAIDDLGSRSSNLDRLGIFQPDIIKIDMQMLRLSLVERSFHEIIYNVSRLAESLGVSLLFEGVESHEEFYKALSFGGRYMQGYLFDEPLPSFVHFEDYRTALQELIGDFYHTKVSEIRSKVAKEELLELLIQKVGIDIEFAREGSTLSFDRILEADKSILRFYLTDSFGTQMTPNYIKRKDGKIIVENNYINHNWSWRPYFLNHIYETEKDGAKWVISPPYHDIQENVLLRTFSKTYGGDFILFIDVLYEE